MLSRLLRLAIAVGVFFASPVVAQDKPRQYLRIRRAVTVTDGDKEAGLFPFAGFRVSISIDYDHPLFCQRHSQASVDIEDAGFLGTTCQARTWDSRLESAPGHDSRRRRRPRPRASRERMRGTPSMTSPSFDAISLACLPRTRASRREALSAVPSSGAVNGSASVLNNWTCC